MAASSSLFRQVELSDFYQRVLADFREAAKRPVERTYRICGLCVRVKFAHEGLVAPLTRALAHLEDEGEPALTISVFDTASSGISLKAPEWVLGGIVARGELNCPEVSRYRVVYSAGSSILSLFDEKTSEGIYFAEDIKALKPWDEAAPFLAILHLFLRKRGIQVVHAAAVADEKGNGALLIGPGGAGKSTTSTGCLGAGMRFLGDDYTAIGCNAPYRVYSLFSSGKLTPFSLKLLGISEETVLIPEEQKALLFFQDRFAPLIARAANLKAVIMPSVGAKRAGYERLSSAEALRAFAPSCILQLAYSGGELFSHLSRVVREVPCFRLELGEDPVENSRLVREIIA